MLAKAALNPELGSGKERGEADADCPQDTRRHDLVGLCETNGKDNREEGRGRQR